MIMNDSFYQSIWIWQYLLDHFITKKTKIHFCNIRSLALKASHFIMESLISDQTAPVADPEFDLRGWGVDFINVGRGRKF